MANAVNTGSTLSLTSGINKTSTSLSTNILITVNGVAVGAVQSLSVNEGRKVTMVDEVGTDGHIDSAPNGSTNIGGSCKRVRFDRLRIAEAFGRGFIHVSSQVYPFDIVIIDRQKRDSALHISTVIKNVWITKISYSYSQNDWIITDDMDWEAETIYSHLGVGNDAVAVGGELGIKHASPIMGIDGNLPNIEQLTDTGAAGRRGSLDASGLIDLGVDGADLF